MVLETKYRSIYDAIINNTKRRTKAKDREQARKYVIAECATQKIHLTSDEIIHVACAVALDA